MTEVPFRATIDDGKIDVPDHIADYCTLEDGDVVTVSILLNSGDVPPEDELAAGGTDV